MIPILLPSALTLNQTTSSSPREGVNLASNILHGIIPAQTPQFPTQMKILVWNCTSVGRPEFVTTSRNLIHRFNPHVVIIMETRLAGNNATQVANDLLF